MADATVRMSQPQPGPAASPAAIARLRKLSRPRPISREAIKSFSPAEIGAVVVLLALVVATVLVYSYSILPGQVTALQLSSQHAANASRIEELQMQLSSPGHMKADAETVRSSLETFEGEYLKPRIAGRLAIVKTVEELTRKTGVMLTSPVSFTTALPSSASESQRGRNRVAKASAALGEVSSYPSLGLNYSISGTYAQLRQFVNGFEQSSQFVVFNSISLSQSEGLPGVGQSAPGGGSGEVITLDIDMTAYFQPEGRAVAGEAVPAAPAAAAEAARP